MLHPSNILFIWKLILYLRGLAVFNGDEQTALHISIPEYSTQQFFKRKTDCRAYNSILKHNTNLMILPNILHNWQLPISSSCTTEDLIYSMITIKYFKIENYFFVLYSRRFDTFNDIRLFTSSQYPLIRYISTESGYSEGHVQKVQNKCQSE